LIRYNQSHLPGAHSIPVPLLEEKQAEVLPKNKDLPLVFYCGGPT
jgi:rhodanese-related sulfurtransferase